MRRIVIAAAMSICVVSLPAIASADTLIMRDGARVSGRVVSVAVRTITFEDVTGVSRRYNADQVDALEFSPANQLNAAAAASGNSALIGAAGGAGVQVLNKGKDVRVPAETLLTFRLSAPANLLPER
jgi:hypothetical protein